MFYKKLVNRNCKDQKWINEFCASKLNNESFATFNCTDKMKMAISRNGRYLEVHIDRFATRDDILFYNDLYFLHVNTSTNKATLIDIVKYTKKQFASRLHEKMETLENRKNKYTTEILAVVKKIDIINAFLESQELPFPNFTQEVARKNKIEEKKINKIEAIKKELINQWEKLEDLEDEKKEAAEAEAEVEVVEPFQILEVNGNEVISSVEAKHEGIETKNLKLTSIKKVLELMHEGIFSGLFEVIEGFFEYDYNKMKYIKQ